MRLLYISTGVTWPFCWVDEAIFHAIKEADVDAHFLNVHDFPRHVDMLEFIEQHKPEAILTMNSTGVSMDFFTHLRMKGFKTALWCTDDPYDNDSSMPRARLFDWIITDERGCVEPYKRLGNNKVFYVPLGADTLQYKKLAVDSNYMSDICILGTGFDVRLRAIDYMADYLNSKNTVIIGHRWERLKSYSLLKHRIRDIVPPAEAVKYYNGAKIVINIHRAYDCKYMNKNSRKLPAYSPNNRVFDIAASGAFQIIGVRRDIKKYLENGKDCVIAKDSNEIIKFCEYYLKHPEERSIIAENARSNVMANHKMSDRIRHIVNLLKV